MILYILPKGTFLKCKHDYFKKFSASFTTSTHRCIEPRVQSGIAGPPPSGPAFFSAFTAAGLLTHSFNQHFIRHLTSASPSAQSWGKSDVAQLPPFGEPIECAGKPNNCKTVRHEHASPVKSALGIQERGQGNKYPPTP